MQQLFDYFQNNPITVKQIRTYLKDKENLKLQLLYKYNDYKDRFSFLVYVRYMLLGIEDKKCLKCGKLLNNQQIRKDADYCSLQCANSSDYVKQNRKDAFVNKYGVQNPLQIVGVNEKKKQSYLKHYGVQHPLKSKQVIQRIKQTNLQRYGVQFGLASKQIQQKSRKTVKEKYDCQYISQSQDVKNKVKKTNLQKYGVQFATQNKEIKSKIKKTNLQKYGVQFVLQNEEIKSKVKKTNLQRYGVQCFFSSKEIREKSKQTNLQRYGSENYFSSQQFLNRNRLDVYETLKQKFKDYVIPLFSEKEYIGCRYKQQYNWKCVKCGNQWKQHLHVSYHIDGKQTYIPRCLNCYPFTVFSKQQEQLFCYIKNICDNVVDKDRKIIYPYELDIYIPQKNIAFEFDGLYWHGQKIKDKNYHLMKTELCKEKGIQLIHIFEDQWLCKQDIVKDRIKNILGVYDNRIFARKCEIKAIKSSVCNQFLDVNHIQGRDNSKIRLGLFCNEELISVMTFSKPRFNKNYEYQLVRFASKLGYQVIGGASKLLKYFERKYNPKSLISYADRRYSNGKLYYALGFEFLDSSQPNYRWYKNFETYSRYQYQKHKLKELLGQDKFDQNLSESQNMRNNKFHRIYDCGNMVFVKTYNKNHLTV